jgi:DNA-binding MarR family transcriptional regulator
MSTSGTLPLLIQLTKSIYRRATEDVIGIKLKAYLTLAALRDGQMSQQELCTAVHMDPNNCVLMLNELEAMGFVERRRDPADRRRHIVVMTEAGRKALAYAEQGVASLEDEVLSALTPEERGQFREMLIRALSRQPAAV